MSLNTGLITASPNIAGGPVSVFASCLAAAQVQMLKLETAYLCWLLADCNL